jgi:hypothetical protein
VIRGGARLESMDELGKGDGERATKAWISLNWIEKCANLSMER